MLVAPHRRQKGCGATRLKNPVNNLVENLVTLASREHM